MNKLGENFEDSFKNAFENAEWTPPANLWGDIETKLELNQKVGIEEAFKATFVGAEMLPPADIWVKIEKDLQNRRYRAWAYRSIGVLAVAVLTLGIAHFFSISDNANLVPLNAAKTEKVTTNGNKNTASVFENEGTSQELAPHASSKSIENEKQIAPEKTPQNVHKANFEDKNTPSNRQIRPNSTSKSSTPTQPLLKNKVEIAVPIIEEKNTKTSEKTIILTPKNEVIAANSNENKVSGIDVVKNGDIINANSVELIVLPIELLPLITPEMGLLILSNNGKTVVAQVDTKNTKMPSQIQFWLSAQGGYGSFSPNFALNPTTSVARVQGADSSALVQDVMGQTKGQITTFGFDAGIKLGNKFYLSSGLTYSQSQTDIQTNLYDKVAIPLVLGDSMLVKTTNRLSTRYQYFSVPLRAEYHFGQKKLNFFLNGGVALQYFNKVAYLSENSQYAYYFGEHNKFGTALLLGGGLSYQYNKALQFALVGDYRSTLKSMIQSTGTQALPESSQIMLRIRYLW